jgi:hypothetical protein
VLDGATGKQIAQAVSDAGADDLFFDAATSRAYLIAGSGAVDSFSVGSPGKLTPLSVTRTAAGAKTGLLDEPGHALYVGVPGMGEPSAIRVYDTK